MNRKTDYWLITCLICGLCSIWYLCNKPKGKVPIQEEQSIQDSIARIRRENILTNKLRASNFENYIYNIDYTVGYDSLKNQKMFLDGYHIHDIKKTDTGIVATVAPAIANDYKINLLVPDSLLIKIKSHDSRRSVIVFTYFKVVKQKDSDELPVFNFDGNLLSIQKL